MIMENYNEGEYLNVEKNGKGKEYYQIELRFEDVYLNGKRWNGKGKEYYYGELRLRFEGQYLNGEINGKGNEYNYVKSIFEGEHSNIKRKEYQFLI